jgi:hypothetical protein
MSTVPCGTRMCRKNFILPFVQGLDQDRHPVPDPNSKFTNSSNPAQILPGIYETGNILLCDFRTMSDLARKVRGKAFLTMDCDGEILPEIRASRSPSPGALIIDDSIEESCAGNDNSTEIHEINSQASTISKSVSSNPPAVCTLCGMQVTCMNIHWRLNHRKVRMQPGAAKFGLGFQIGGSDSPLNSSTPVRKIRKRKKKVSAAAITAPAGFKRERLVSPTRVEVCREPDPLELYPGGGSADDSRTFSLESLSPSAQKSVVQSLVFLTQLGGSNFLIYFCLLMGLCFLS